jgi:hypothetical protein
MRTGSPFGVRGTVRDAPRWWILAPLCDVRLRPVQDLSHLVLRLDLEVFLNELEKREKSVVRHNPECIARYSRGGVEGSRTISMVAVARGPFTRDRLRRMTDSPAYCVRGHLALATTPSACATSIELRERVARTRARLGIT